jgi:hypothetical protein
VAPNHSRRRGVEFLEAKPKIARRDVVDTKPSTIIAPALVAIALSPIAVTAITMLVSAVVATELSPIAVEFLVV